MNKTFCLCSCEKGPKCLKSGSRMCCHGSMLEGIGIISCKNGDAVLRLWVVHIKRSMVEYVGILKEAEWNGLTNVLTWSLPKFLGVLQLETAGN